MTYSAFKLNFAQQIKLKNPKTKKTRITNNYKNHFLEMKLKISKIFHKFEKLFPVVLSNAF